MRILLISPRRNITRDKEEYPSGALLNLGTIAKNLGHEVKLLHTEISSEPTGYILSQFDPEIVGITVNSYQIRSARVIARVARKIDHLSSLLIGGPHVTALGERIFEEIPEANYALFGEGEVGWNQFLTHKSDPINLVSKNSPVEGSRRINYCDDLDKILPIPDLSLIDIKQFTGPQPKGKQPSMFIMGSRGCPFSCIFCQSNWGRKVRYRSPELIVNEVEAFHTNHGIKEIFFQDDTFNLNSDWSKSIFSEIIRRGLNRKLIFRIVCRCDSKLIDRDWLKLAKEAGVWLIFYGVESLDQGMLDSMGKHLFIGEIERAFKLTQEAGIMTHASFIIGLPGETWETAQNTLEGLKELKPDSFSIGPPTPFPDTKLREMVIQSGHLLDSNYDNYSPEKCAVRTDVLSSEDIMKIIGKF